jgi:uncharacterized RDD family membrane protein YckC
MTIEGHSLKENYIIKNEISAGTRLGAMLLDHFFMTITAVLFFVPGMVSGFAEAFTVSHKPVYTSFISGTAGYIGLLGMALYFCKDIFNGRSIAKRILKLQVVDNTTGQAASPVKCFIRNIFCMVWPVEGIVALGNTSRRLGDRVAGTKLVIFDPASEQPKLNLLKLLLSVALAYGMLLSLLKLTPSTGIKKFDIRESSYNAVASKNLEQLLADSLGQYFTPDIKVYDTIANENLQYISIILRLKDDYLEDSHIFFQLDEKISALVYSKYPQPSITGQIKYVYKMPGHTSMRSSEIGKGRMPNQGN